MKKTIKAYIVMQDKKIMPACQCCYRGQIIAVYPSKKIAESIMSAKENGLLIQKVSITFTPTH